MAHWVCKVTWCKGQARITLPRGLLKTVKWNDVEHVEITQLPFNMLCMERLKYAKKKGPKDSRDPAKED